MKIKSTFLSILFLVFVYSIQAQKIKDETIEYNYLRLPLQPLDKSITNYQATIFATYEEANTKKKNEYEAEKKKAQDDFNRETAEYPANVKAAEDKYTAEMVEYDKKSLADKVIEKKVMGEDNKPVKQIPSKPYLRSVAEPKLQTSYDYPVVANTYLNIGGLANNATNAVNMKVTVHGFDYTQPRQMTVQKNMTSYANGQSSTRAVTYYYIEFSYRHPMAVQVTSPDGTVLINETPQELNAYTIYKTAETEKLQSINTEMLVKTNEELIFQKNLQFINNMVNDKIGNQKVSRSGKIFFIKEKSDNYSDLLNAYNDASTGFKLIADNEAEGKAKLENAVKLFTTALTESDLENKKARIDKDVTIMIYFNLLECYFALRNDTDGLAILDKLGTMKLSYDEKKSKEEFDLLFIDLKKRIQANK